MNEATLVGDMRGTLETLLEAFDRLPAGQELPPPVAEILNYVNVQVRAVVDRAKTEL